jgi:hypothetical protein
MAAILGVTIVGVYKVQLGLEIAVRGVVSEL